MNDEPIFDTSMEQRSMAVSVSLHRHGYHAQADPSLNTNLVSVAQHGLLIAPAEVRAQQANEQKLAARSNPESTLAGPSFGPISGTASLPPPGSPWKVRNSD